MIGYQHLEEARRYLNGETDDEQVREDLTLLVTGVDDEALAATAAQYALCPPHSDEPRLEALAFIAGYNTACRIVQAQARTEA